MKARSRVLGLVVSVGSVAFHLLCDRDPRTETQCNSGAMARLPDGYDVLDVGSSFSLHAEIRRRPHCVAPRRADIGPRL